MGAYEAYDEWLREKFSPESAEGMVKSTRIYYRYLRDKKAPTPEEIFWLLEHTEKYFILSDVADDQWASASADLLAKNLEISELIRQIEEK